MYKFSWVHHCDYRCPISIWRQDKWEHFEKNMWYQIQWDPSIMTKVVLLKMQTFGDFIDKALLNHVYVTPEQRPPL